MPSRVYTKEEADAILTRAIELQRGDATSHEDLVAAAREVGVAPEAIEKAAAEVLGRRRDEEDVKALRARAWRGFFAHLVPYVLVSGLLAFINVMTGGFPWVLIVMLAWGVGLGSHLFAVAAPDREKLVKRARRERARAMRWEGRVDLEAGARARVVEGAGAGAGGIRVEEGPLDDEDGEPAGSARRQVR
jgi:hypothetical protein